MGWQKIHTDAVKTTFYILATLLVLSVASCTTTRYIPIESVRTEIEYRDRLRTDSIFVSDSVYIREKGDTIFVEHTRYAYRDRMQVDTAYVCITDSVQVPYPVPAQLSSWQRFKQDVGGIAIGVLAVVITLGLIWVLRRIKIT